VRALLAVAWITSFVLTACGGGGATVQEGQGGSGSDVGGPVLDWNDPQQWQDPFGEGTTVGSRSEAAAQLPFAPVVPDPLGSPARIVVRTGDATDPTDDAMGLIYDHPKFGKFWVLEGLAQTTQADLESIAENCDPASGCESTNAMVPLNGGIRALQVAGSTTNSIAWLYNGVRFDVLGPTQTFTLASALEVAHLVSEDAR
jgi:hypothetical protein